MASEAVAPRVDGDEQGLATLAAARFLGARPNSRALFRSEALKAIEDAIGLSESTHSGEIRFAVEGALEPHDVWAGKTPRARALEVFARLGVWDTEANNGVLIYLLLADRDVEIVADRGLNGRVERRRMVRGVCDDGRSPAQRAL